MEQPTPHKSKNPKRKDGKPTLERNKARYVNAKKMAQRYLQMGFSHADVREKLMEDFGYSELSAKDLIQKLNKEIDAKFEKYSDRVAQLNIKRLEALIEESFEKGNVKEVQASLDLLNKMTKQYTQQIKVEGNGDFQIKLDK